MMEELIKLTNALYKVTGLFPTKEPLKFAIRKESLDVLFFCIASEKQAVQSQINQRESFIQKGLDCLKLLKTYFEIAKEQKWIDMRNFLVLESEYLLVENTLNNELLKIISDKKFSIPKAEMVEKEIIEKKEEPKREFKQEVEKKATNIAAIQLKEAVKKSEAAIEEKSFDEIDYEKLTSIQLKVLELLQGSGQLKPNEINKHFPDVTPRSIRRELKGLKERHIIGTVGSGKTISYKINLAV